MRLLAPVLVLLVTLPASAQVSADLAEAYLDASGLPDQLGAVGEQIGQQVHGQAAGQLPEPARAPLQAIYAGALSADALTARARAYVEAEGEADSLEAALPWYDQPLVGQMQALQEAASEDADAQVAMQMYAMTGSFAATEISPEREAQMDRYLALTGDAEAGVELYLDIIVAMQESTAALSNEAPTPADSVRARVRPMLEANVGGAMRGSALYAYREVPDEDLDAYLDLVEMPTAQYGLRLGREAVSAALVGAITDAGQRFAQALLDLDAAGEIDLDTMRASDG